MAIRGRAQLAVAWAFACLLSMPGVVHADQNAEELDPLFEKLSNATSSSQATALEAQIWQHWLIAPDANASALMSQVVYAMQERQLSLAIKLCDQLIDSSPNFAEAWNKRATLHYLTGNMDASVDDIKQTIKLEPRHFGAISGLGLIFLQRGDYQSSLDAFEQVLKINPQSGNTRRSIEQVRDKIGSEI